MSFGQHRAHGNRMHGIKGSVFALTLVCILSVSLVAMPYTAYAESLEDLQANIEKSNNNYNNATNQVADLQQKIQDNEARIKEIENQLPEQRSRAAASIANTYRMQQGSLGIIDLILSTDNFNDLISLLQYLNIISSRNADTINNLVNLSNELDATKKDLNAQMAEAEKQKQAASDALQEAIDARNALQNKWKSSAQQRRLKKKPPLLKRRKKLRSPTTPSPTHQVSRPTMWHLPTTHPITLRIHLILPILPTPLIGRMERVLLFQSGAAELMHIFPGHP